MSNKNTTPASIELATEEQIDLVLGLSLGRIRRQLRLGQLTKPQAQALIRRGNVFNRAFEQMLSRVLPYLDNIVTRKVTVDRSRSLRNILMAQNSHIILASAATCFSEVENCKPIPGHGPGKEIVEVVFFKPEDGPMTPEQEDAERDFLGLVKDVNAQAAVNEQDPEFRRNFPNEVRWAQGNGENFELKWFFTTTEQPYPNASFHLGYPNSETYTRHSWLAGVAKEVSTNRRARFGSSNAHFCDGLDAENDRRGGPNGFNFALGLERKVMIERGRQMGKKMEVGPPGTSTISEDIEECPYCHTSLIIV